MESKEPGLSGLYQVVYPEVVQCVNTNFVGSILVTTILFVKSMYWIYVKQLFTLLYCKFHLQITEEFHHKMLHVHFVDLRKMQWKNLNLKENAVQIL